MREQHDARAVRTCAEHFAMAAAGPVAGEDDPVCAGRSPVGRSGAQGARDERHDAASVRIDPVEGLLGARAPEDQPVPGRAPARLRIAVGVREKLLRAAAVRSHRVQHCIAAGRAVLERNPAGGP